MDVQGRAQLLGLRLGAARSKDTGGRSGWGLLGPGSGAQSLLNVPAWTPGSDAPHSDASTC